MHKIISISVTERDWDYVMEDDILKPSSIYRSAVESIRLHRQGDVDKIKQLQNQNKIIQKSLFEEQEKVKDLQDQLVNYKK